MFTDVGDLGRIVCDYFTNLFAAPIDSDYNPVINFVKPMVNDEDNAFLIRPFEAAEFKDAIFDMKPDKAPGPDGLNPAFYQRYWKLIGDDLFAESMKWIDHGYFPPSLNDTNICLIPKCDNPENMQDLRPISLCNVLYKVFAKVLANRLKSTLSKVISEFQSTFVPGRSIIDNILVAFEIIHSMKRKRKSKVGDVAIKIDISKAYDRLDWGFLEHMMGKLGFSQRRIGLIMLCVKSVKYSVLVNGSLVGPIVPKHGLRQGCPLFPYLFIICAQGISSLLERDVARGDIHGVKVCRGAPSVSHLLLADDSFFFLRANNQECEKIKSIFSIYEKASGQAINFSKSGVFYSVNVDVGKQVELSNILGISNSLGNGKYLGLPSMVGRNKSEIFGYLKDRLWKRINSWSGKFLSKAGREVLIKSVAQALPAYCMNVFLLPHNVTDRLEKMMNSFWWGLSSKMIAGIKWMSWDRLCVPKEKGGMGFRNLHGFNVAMLGKQGWKLISDSDALISRIYKAKYYPMGDFISANLGHNPSFTWRSIWSSRALVVDGLRWKVGDGTNINIWQSPWLRDLENPFIETPYDPDLDIVNVCDLIKDDTKRRNEDLITMVFSERDANQILSILLNNKQGKDKRIWSHAANGQFSVKIGYHVMMNRMVREEEYAVPGDWDKLWALKIPPKVKCFLWRASRDCLPTRTRLQSMGVAIPITCPYCTNDLEDS